MHRYFLILLFALALPAHAQVMQYFHVQSGTGFFVNDAGYALTNEHVVRGCSTVLLKGPRFAESEAEVVALDAEHDLALLRSYTRPRDVAPLRDNLHDLRPGDKVLVIGYPGDAWKTGIYRTSEASMVALEGLPDHPDWIQFSDSIHHGNSGGPLLDGSGNVIGVVVAMVQQQRMLYRVNQATGEKQLVETTNTTTDGAIGLPSVETFLRSHGVSYREARSWAEGGSYSVEQRANDFIVNVQCRKPINEQPTDKSIDPYVLQIQ